MPKLIIVIHGRSNKPKKTRLTQDWEKSVNEGLKITSHTKLTDIDFKMAYYANIYYPQALSNKNNTEPYMKAKKGAIKTYPKGIAHRVRKIAENWLGRAFDWLDENNHIFSKLARRIAKKVLQDLGEYYTNKVLRDKINKRLKKLLLAHQKDEIILIAHSMGTIIAYEVLTQLAKSSQYPNFSIAHFITMGSPLGLTVIKGNILASHKSMSTPTCVTTSWVNFSDPQDFVALDSHLGDDYGANSASVQVEDVMVCNDYPNNKHKSYGYLRTPEFSKHLTRLLLLPSRLKKDKNR